jgi:hypothetical protein
MFRVRLTDFREVAEKNRMPFSYRKGRWGRRDRSPGLGMERKGSKAGKKSEPQRARRPRRQADGMANDFLLQLRLLCQGK